MSRLPEHGPAPERPFEIEVVRPFGRLAGTVWLPRSEDPHTVVLMHPGSGASDRSNDGYFSAIRRLFLSRGCGVVSFDKRGVGGSDGSWWLAGIEAQAHDVAACVRSVRDLLGDAPQFGLFGHSQGGWVVVEAAAQGLEASFIVSNSGPAVSPVTQERFALDTRMRAAGVDERTLADLLSLYDELIELARRNVPLQMARERLEGMARDYPRAADWIELISDDKSWLMMTHLAGYDPEPALRAIRVPLLVLYGAADDLVPVEASARAARTCVRPEHLNLQIVAGADHRLQSGEPPSLHRSFVDILDTFLAQALEASSHRDTFQ